MTGRRPLRRLSAPPAQARPAALATVVLLVLWWAGATVAQEPSLRLDILPEGDVGADEVLRLTLTIDAPGNGRVSQPRFRLDNLTVVSGPSRSTSVRIVNGVSSRSYAYTWMIQPQQLGQARIYGGEVQIGQQAFTVPERTLSVVENPPQRPRRQRSDPFGRMFSNDPFFSRDPFEGLSGRQRSRRPRRQPRAPEIFLRAHVEPRSPWVGQQVLYTLYLYTDVDVRSVTPTELPDFKGFWTRVIPQPQDARPEIVTHDGREIGRIVLLQRALFPRRAGELEIGAVEASMTAMVRDSGPFGSLMPRMGEVARRSDSARVQVRELPEGPVDFGGAVGDLRLDASLEPQELEVGEAATLTLSLKGRGHLQGILDPKLPELAGLEAFPPQQQSGENVRGSNIHGSRTWSFVLVPQRPGTYELPSVDIPYFDPKRGEFRTAESGPLRLSVRGSQSLPAEGGATTELHGIRERALATQAPEGRGWPASRHLLFLLPAALGLLGLGIRRSRGSSTSAGGGRSARRRLLEQLKLAHGEQRPGQAAAAIEDAWRAYLETRWRIPRSEPSSRWSRLLAERGAPRGASEDLVKLAEDLHYLRYAPKLSSTEELQGELVERSKRLSRALK
ncbi:MAG: BatD family protein [Acidobacteriota bacterium]